MYAGEPDPAFIVYWPVTRKPPERALAFVVVTVGFCNPVGSAPVVRV